MTSPPSIVAPAGPSALDRAVIREAARIAAQRGCALHLVCAYQPSSATARERARRRLPGGLRLDYEDERVGEARTMLADARDRLPHDLVVHLHHERGDGAAALRRVAQREAAELIVVGFSGRAGRRLLAHAPCPVRVVGGAPAAPPTRDVPPPRPSSRPEFAFAGIMRASDRHDAATTSTSRR
jgi:nucleotide-binding universal stress UspA family protein